MTTIITGGRPSGKLHLGHYISAFKAFTELQEKNNTKSLMIIADVHYLTAFISKTDIKKIWNNTLIMMRDAISMGVDPSKTSIYLQSNIASLPRISLLFQNLVDVKSASSVYSYQASTKKSDDKKNTVGLLAYPIMEAADVFAVGADYVTVGRDNVEHIIMARNIIDNINHEYGANFNLPEYITDPNRNFIRGIDGNEKMSKSLLNVIFIDETTDGVIDKVTNMPWSNSSSENLILEYLDALIPEKYDKENIKLDKSDEHSYKDELIDVIEGIWEPMRTRREKLDFSDDDLLEIIQNGTRDVNYIVEKRTKELIDVMGLPQIYQ